MGIIATITDAATGQQLQKHVFGRLPAPGTPFILKTGERVTAQRVVVGKPAQGTFVTPVDVWVFSKA